MLRVSTVDEHNRMSTQDLLLAIGEAVKQGETDFEIKASGQHDIGGPLWHPEGKKLHFHVWNAGQRTGSMCLPGTEIVIEESTSADVGWLNAGAKIIVHGNATNGAANAMAQGRVYIGGNIGARGMTMTKYNPRFEPPELWVFGKAGDSFAEFMAGGIAVICGAGAGQSVIISICTE
mgnify:CR=1 FL=1